MNHSPLIVVGALLVAAVSYCNGQTKSECSKIQGLNFWVIVDVSQNEMSNSWVFPLVEKMILRLMSKETFPNIVNMTTTISRSITNKDFAGYFLFYKSPCNSGECVEEILNFQLIEEMLGSDTDNVPKIHLFPLQRKLKEIYTRSNLKGSVLWGPSDFMLQEYGTLCLVFTFGIHTPEAGDKERLASDLAYVGNHTAGFVIGFVLLDPGFLIDVHRQNFEDMFHEHSPGFRLLYKPSEQDAMSKLNELVGKLCELFNPTTTSKTSRKSEVLSREAEATSTKSGVKFKVAKPPKSSEQISEASYKLYYLAGAGLVLVLIVMGAAAALILNRKRQEKKNLAATEAARLKSAGRAGVSSKALAKKVVLPPQVKNAKALPLKTKALEAATLASLRRK